MEKKITKKDYYNAILDILAHQSENHVEGEKGIAIPDIRLFVEHELDLLAKKNASRNSKPTKSATETAEVAERILAVMEPGKRYTVSEVQALDPMLKEKSNQRMTAGMNVLKGTGFVENIPEKGKSYYIKL